QGAGAHPRRRFRGRHPRSARLARAEARPGARAGVRVTKVSVATRGKLRK
ncbi:MAG: hypothetical protein RL751_1778, partial [Bacteroidota bacterium]